jgi:hypothetical protein
VRDKNQGSDFQNAPIEVASLISSVGAAFREDLAMRKSALQAFFAAVTLAGVSCGAARAAMLTFDITETSSGGWVGNFSGAPQDYGDRVAAFSTASGLSTYRYGSAEGPTPDIEVGQSPTVADVDLWDISDADLNRFSLPYDDGVGILEVILTADPGYELNLHGLDMEVWNVPIAPSVSLEW